ncbi:2-oxo acid dehydrogenase subunit E2 [Streptacidiphilus sp. PB12-B1b]|nr:2-oxo acid dehydrogenase subunit E2 [Streptacidiphilus sp. PB12-B1b]
MHLGADVVMTGVQRHRAAARERGASYSVVSYLLYAGARVLAAHPEANAGAAGRLLPRTVRHDRVHAKLALDRDTPHGRAVHTAVLRDADRLGLPALQRLVDRCRDAPLEELPGAAGVRLLDRLPPPLGRLAFRAAVARPGRRADLLGTFSVSSLGHRRVDTFHSYGGTAVTLTAGRIAPRPVAGPAGTTTVPVLRLGLTFDHRVIDGAAAADVLEEIVQLLEACDAALPGGWDDPRHPLDGPGQADPADRAGGPLAVLP